jgi:hypothetical protein
VLDGLWAERREERYRAAPLLRRAVAGGESRLSSPDSTGLRGTEHMNQKEAQGSSRWDSWAR